MKTSEFSQCSPRFEEDMHSSPGLSIEREGFEDRLSRFAALYNAVSAWQKGLPPNHNGFAKVFDDRFAPRLLVREDGRPILMLGSLHKVCKSDERDFAHFSEATHLESQLTFLLECTPEQTHYLTFDPRDFDRYARDNYAVIAEIQSVEHDPRSRISCAIGKCVDLLPLSFDEFWGLFYPRGLSAFW